MTDFSKVLWVKFGWSDWYRGEPVDGNFSWLKKQENEGGGFERFNFLPDPDGTYRCYVPPQKGLFVPSNNDSKGWTVICLAKNPKHKGIHIIGWYENATLHGESMERPTHNVRYCISSKTAYFIPPTDRVAPFSDDSIKQSKYSFLKGPDVKDPKGKKPHVLELLKNRLRKLTPVAIKNPDENNPPDPELTVDPLGGFGTAEHRKKVEIAAENAVIAHYKTKGFTDKRMTTIPCGYDFEFTKGKTVLHVEVKGTASPDPQFFLTRNEYKTGLQSNPRWLLAMVTSALSRPSITVYNAKGLKQAFDLEPYTYVGKFVPEVQAS